MFIEFLHHFDSRRCSVLRYLFASSLFSSLVAHGFVGNLWKRHCTASTRYCRAGNSALGNVGLGASLAVGSSAVYSYTTPFRKCYVSRVDETQEREKVCMCEWYDESQGKGSSTLSSELRDEAIYGNKYSYCDGGEPRS